MIDDYESAIELMEKMRSSTSMLMKPTLRSRQLLIEQGHNLSANDWFQVEHIDYVGDEGGIICCLNSKDEKAMFSMSLTHLEVDPKHPLYDEIRTYQQKRIIRLAIQDGKLGQAKRLAKKQRQSKKKGFGS